MKYELRFSDDQIKKSLHASVKRHIRNTVEKNIKSLEAAVKERYGYHVKKTDEYRHITSENTKFRTEIGVPNSKEVLQSIIDTLLANVEVKINRVLNDEADYIIPITITLFDERILKAVLKAPGASYFSESLRRGTITEVPWLSWLLLSGSEPVVFGFKVMYDKELWSRTENAIMAPSSGDNYKIPERFSGTKEDNFLSRAALEAVNELPILIQREIIGKL